MKDSWHFGIKINLKKEKNYQLEYNRGLNNRSGKVLKDYLFKQYPLMSLLDHSKFTKKSCHAIAAVSPK